MAEERSEMTSYQVIEAATGEDGRLWIERHGDPQESIDAAIDLFADALPGWDLNMKIRGTTLPRKQWTADISIYEIDKPDVKSQFTGAGVIPQTAFYEAIGKALRAAGKLPAARESGEG